MDDFEQVLIYTDGCCEPNPGVGGYAALLLHGKRRREVCGGFSLTTNNRMELWAAVAGLEALRVPCRVEVRSDSRYVVDAVEKGWLFSWAARGWRKGDGGAVANADLWQRLLALCRVHRLAFRWVRGHSGVAGNERCDALAARARRGRGLPADPGYGVAVGSAQAVLPGMGANPATGPPSR